MVYRSPKYGNLSEFFEKLNPVVDLAITKYDNVVILGDINVDTQDSNSPGLNKVQDLSDVFGLKNSIKSTNCVILFSQTVLEVSKIVERLKLGLVIFTSLLGDGH